METGLPPNVLARLEWHLEPVDLVHLACLAAFPLDPLEVETPLAIWGVEQAPDDSTLHGSFVLRERHFERAT